MRILTIRCRAKRLHANRRQRAFSLVEMAVVLAIIGLLFFAFVGPTAVALQQRRAGETATKLTTVDTALALFVAQNYRLPCPANGTLDATNSAVTTAGFEQINVGITACTLTNQTSGIVPWKTIGLTLADVTDGWGNVMTYRVDESLIRAQSMNLTLCSPAGTAAADATLGAPNLRCEAACTTSTFPTSCTSTLAVVAGRGIRVRDIGGGSPVADPTVTPSTGAAFVVISHGENGAGSYTQTGGLNAGGSPASGTEEAKNAANLSNAGAGFYLVENPANYAAGTSHFDDLVLRKSIIATATKAMLGPRAY